MSVTFHCSYPNSTETKQGLYCCVIELLKVSWCESEEHRWYMKETRDTKHLNPSPKRRRLHFNLRVPNGLPKNFQQINFRTYSQTHQNIPAYIIYFNFCDNQILHNMCHQQVSIYLTDESVIFKLFTVLNILPFKKKQTLCWYEMTATWSQDTSTIALYDISEDLH